MILEINCSKDYIFPNIRMAVISILKTRKRLTILLKSALRHTHGGHLRTNVNIHQN